MLSYTGLEIGHAEVQRVERLIEFLKYGILRWRDGRGGGFSLLPGPCSEGVIARDVRDEAIPGRLNAAAR